ncbi:MAG: leucine-rich repeat protein, partial [Clostridia bacterium]|nr:leucine-rich repeat protein [Clostridia bacterium]
YGDMESTLDSNWSDFFIYDVDSDNGGWEFKYNKDKTECTVTVTDKDKIKGKMIIPEDDGNGVPVTKIDNFSFCKNLKSLIMPDTIKSLGRAGAFCDCESLQRVKLPNTIKEIKGNDFDRCESLSEIVIPGNVESVSSNVFTDCKKLTDIKFEDGVKSIGEKPGSYQFFIVIDEFGDEHVYNGINGVFERCESLKKIRLPNTLENFTAALFFNANFDIEVDEENPYYFYDGDYLIRKDSNEIVFARNGTQPIPSYVKRIGDLAFYRFPITEITVPENVESIGDSAFTFCQSLKKVVLPDGLKSIGVSAFAFCYELEEINIPSGITRIENCVFNSCYNLKINIPSNITEIGKQAFYRAEMPVDLPKDVAITDEGAFNFTTIFTSNDSGQSEKWYKFKAAEVDLNWQYYCNIFFNCDLRSDEGINYLYSWQPYTMQYMISYTKDENGEPIEVKVPISNLLNVSTLTNRAVLYDPQRKGYTFKGWTTEEGSDTVVYKGLYIVPLVEVLNDGTVTQRFVLSIEQNKYVQIPEDTAMLYAVWEKN